MKNYWIVLFMLCACGSENQYIYHSEELLNDIFRSEEFSFDQKIVLHGYHNDLFVPLIGIGELQNQLSEYFTTLDKEKLRTKIKLTKILEKKSLLFKNQVSVSELKKESALAKNQKIPIWERFHAKYDNLRGISFPIFSDDYKYAFIYEYTFFSGGSYRIYKKEKEKWILTKVFGEWME